jgi:hypothetical protein
MNSVPRIAILMVLSTAAIACNQHSPAPPVSSPRKEDWQPYNDLPVGSAQPTVTADAFNRVRSGMTLGELVEVLGRGWVCTQYSGTGTINWKCEDGRELSVLPISYRQTEIIRVDGGTGGIGRMWMTAEGGTHPVDIPGKKAT